MTWSSYTSSKSVFSIRPVNMQGHTAMLMRGQSVPLLYTQQTYAIAMP